MVIPKSPTGHSPELTIAAIAAAECAAKPEFCTIAGARPLFGLSRSYLYELEAAGFIRMRRLRKPGHTLGKVLIDCQSVRDFLSRF